MHYKSKCFPKFTNLRKLGCFLTLEVLKVVIAFVEKYDRIPIPGLVPSLTAANRQHLVAGKIEGSNTPSRTLLPF